MRSSPTPSKGVITEMQKSLKDLISFSNGGLIVNDMAGLRSSMDSIIYDAVFSEDEPTKRAIQSLIIEAAKQFGAVPSPIKSLYEAIGEGRYSGFTVPAINIRGLTYDVARAIFRKAKEKSVGAFIFEIARSEIGYTYQRPMEYSACVLAAAIKEDFKCPIFLQGDHFQVVRRQYMAEPEKEMEKLKGLIKEAIEAEFYNIDIDSSTLVSLEMPTIKEQQRPNFEMTAHLAGYIDSIRPEGVEISIGGEIGEIGGKNSTPDELRAFLDGFRETFKKQKALTKISIQTGTTHGGVVLPDGSIARVNIDFDTIMTLSRIARQEYGLGGVVQHGASTLPEEAFGKFPEVETIEIHLATGFQNIIYDSKHLPQEFRQDVYDFIRREFTKDRKEGQSEEQFIYSTRKKGFGPLKKTWWDLPSDIKNAIAAEIEDKVGFLFEKLKVVDTKGIVEDAVRKEAVRKDISESLRRILA